MTPDPTHPAPSAGATPHPWDVAENIGTEEVYAFAEAWFQRKREELHRFADWEDRTLQERVRRALAAAYIAAGYAVVPRCRHCGAGEAVHEPLLGTCPDLGGIFDAALPSGEAQSEPTAPTNDTKTQQLLKRVAHYLDTRWAEMVVGHNGNAPSQMYEDADGLRALAARLATLPAGEGPPGVTP